MRFILLAFVAFCEALLLLIAVAGIGFAVWAIHAGVADIREGLGRDSLITAIAIASVPLLVGVIALVGFTVGAEVRALRELHEEIDERPRPSVELG